MGRVPIVCHWYPSSVNRGYFSYLSDGAGETLPDTGIHPLSIEAISPTLIEFSFGVQKNFVSILCQSRLFLLQASEVREARSIVMYPSSVNRGYFSYDALGVGETFEVTSIHPLSIEAISPT